MLFTLLPIVMEVRFLQQRKAPRPMPITLLPIVMEAKPSQPSKAESPMLSTLLPIVTEVRLLQQRKAPVPMTIFLLFSIGVGSFLLVSVLFCWCRFFFVKITFEDYTTISNFYQAKILIFFVNYLLCLCRSA